MMRRSGWVTFAAVVMIVAGIMRVFDAIWAFRYNGETVDNLRQAIFGHSLNTYGWIWLIGGVILIAAGIFLFTPTTMAAQISRWIGIVGSGLVAITSASWFAYYPVWSLIYVGLAVLVIYGLAVHYDDEVAVTGQ
jgi:hypothetical protein